MNRKPEAGKHLAGRAAVRLVLGILALATILFMASGRLDWGMAWAYLGVVTSLLIFNLAVLLKTNPGVIEERLRGTGEPKRWDKVLAGFLAVFALGAYVVAGLDYRLGWSPAITLHYRVAPLALVVLGDLLFLWAMAVNPFFSKLVSIQAERGHRVIVGGPYRYVRHPGYVGWIMMTIAIPPSLGSLWAFIPAGTEVCLIIVRTALEDRMLRRELDGYREYAGRIRYRLLPGLW